MARVVVQQLTVNDNRKLERDCDIDGEYVWVFKTGLDVVCYLKFKIDQDKNWVKFISFDENYNT